MPEKGLVSTITPCYNGEKHIFRLLDSILSQTYPRIETIIVDDGSTDNTKGVVQSYVSKFEAKGYTLLYIYQENSGQAAAINKGLDLYTGEYLAWPDSDDYYSSSESIEKMVNALKDSDEKTSMVRTNALVVDEDSLALINKIRCPRLKREQNLFLDCILENKFNFVPGKFLVKSGILNKELTHNNIYVSRGGQNWQLLLPILYNYTIITIHDFLYTVVARSNSHSRSIINSYEVQIKRAIEHEVLLKETVLRLKNIVESDRNELLEIIGLKYKRRRLNLYYKEKMKNEFLRIYNDILEVSSQSLTIKDKFMKMTIGTKVQSLYLYIKQLTGSYIPHGAIRNILAKYL